MKSLLLGALWWGLACAVQAQWPSPDELKAQSAVLDARRLALDDQYKQEMRLCYQNFDVTSCRLQARDKQIQANAQLRKDELAHKNLERQIKSAQAQQRSLERDSQEQQQQADREQAVKAAREREQSQADKLSEHAAKGGQREAYEQKQREAQTHRDDLEKMRRERNANPAKPLPVPGTAP
jgi:hypothetical protein